MHLTKKNDYFLVNGILKGEEKALLLFYRRFAPKLFAFIKKQIYLPEDAEEILQDVLLSALDALRDFNFNSSLDTFLHAIAKNKIIDFYRRKKIKKLFFSQLPQLESFLTTILGPEEMFEEKQLSGRIKKALACLTPQHRRILTLKYWDGLSVKQITQKLKISFKSAESRLFRARRAFAKVWELV